MSEFSFLGTWRDSWAILNSILEGDNFSLVLDQKYDEPVPLCVRALNDEVEAILRDRRHLFIWGKNFSLFPPALERIDEGLNAGKYFVRLSKAGPGLELTLPPCYEASGVLVLGPGTLSYPRQWSNPADNAWLKATTELKAGFKEVKGRLQRHLVRHRTDTAIWIGRDADQLVEAKKARISGFEGRHASGRAKTAMPESGT